MYSDSVVALRRPAQFCCLPSRADTMNTNTTLKSDASSSFVAEEKSQKRKEAANSWPGGPSVQGMKPGGGPVPVPGPSPMQQVVGSSPMSMGSVQGGQAGGMMTNPMMAGSPSVSGNSQIMSPPPSSMRPPSAAMLSQPSPGSMMQVQGPGSIVRNQSPGQCAN